MIWPRIGVRGYSVVTLASTWRVHILMQNKGTITKHHTFFMDGAGVDWWLGWHCAVVPHLPLYLGPWFESKQSNCDTVWWLGFQSVPDCVGFPQKKILRGLPPTFKTETSFLAISPWGSWLISWFKILGFTTRINNKLKRKWNDMVVCHRHQCLFLHCSSAHAVQYYSVL